MKIYPRYTGRVWLYCAADERETTTREYRTPNEAIAAWGRGERCAPALLAQLGNEDATS